jgi:4-amino-4-deoxy-L-arabinose transferase-like glycosyltransferase
MTIRRFWTLVLLITAAAGYLELSSAMMETQTFDEGMHIAAGYSYLTRGDYRWNREHPPLVKLVSALPLLRLSLDLPLNSNSWRNSDLNEVGVQFLYHNRSPADDILFASRGANIALSLVFLIALAWWTYGRLNPWPALLAVWLCAFDPNLIAHARYVTTDFPLMVFFFFASVFWAEYLAEGRRRDLVLAAVAFAAAMLTKFSGVLLIPVFTILYAVRWFRHREAFPIRRALLAAAVVCGITFAAVCLAYWPETLRSLRGEIPPGDHAFFAGLRTVISHNRLGHPSYLLGMRSNTGWWFYFPVVWAVKSTVAALLAAAVVLIGLTVGRGGSPALQFVVPPLVYFAISMTSGIDIGVRHILPVYPFLYVAAAAFLSRVPWKRAARYAMLVLAGLQIAECASISPHYLAFFNTLAGGPGKGPQYLVDSNIDWGQDIKKLARWLEAHGTNRAWIADFGSTPLSYYGIKPEFFPAPSDQKGWDAIDGFAAAEVTRLYGPYDPPEAFARLRAREPIAKIGWSIYVYDLRKGHAP